MTESKEYKLLVSELRPWQCREGGRQLGGTIFKPTFSYPFS